MSEPKIILEGITVADFLARVREVAAQPANDVTSLITAKQATTMLGFKNRRTLYEHAKDQGVKRYGSARRPMFRAADIEALAETLGKARS